MIVYILQSKQLGWVEDVFVGNADALTEAEEKRLRARAAKLGFLLVKRTAEPAGDLADAIDGLEKEERDAKAAG